MPTPRMLKIAGRVLKDPLSCTGREAQEMAGVIVDLAPDKPRLPKNWHVMDVKVSKKKKTQRRKKKCTR